MGVRPVVQPHPEDRSRDPLFSKPTFIGENRLLVEPHRRRAAPFYRSARKRLPTSIRIF